MCRWILDPIHVLLYVDRPEWSLMEITVLIKTHRKLFFFTRPVLVDSYWNRLFETFPISIYYRQRLVEKNNQGTFESRLFELFKQWNSGVESVIKHCLQWVFFFIWAVPVLGGVPNAKKWYFFPIAGKKFPISSKKNLKRKEFRRIPLN